MKTIKQIRDQFECDLRQGNTVANPTGGTMLEMINVSFIADEDHIFGDPNHDYIDREIQWYLSQSLNVNDIPGNTPAIWQRVSDNDGFINSNYGWCVFSEENGNQFENVVSTLVKTPNSRQAMMIYTRPSMHSDSTRNGRYDFMCTNTVQYLYRDEKLHALVSMRSNDAWAGYRNDVAWQDYVLNKLSKRLGMDQGHIYWNVGSFHIYDNQYYLVDHFGQTGQTHVLKKNYVGSYKY
jgi:thymidylate synthase